MAGRPKRRAAKQMRADRADRASRDRPATAARGGGVAADSGWRASFFPFEVIEAERAWSEQRAREQSRGRGRGRARGRGRDLGRADEMPPASERFVFASPQQADVFDYRMRASGFRPTRERPDGEHGLPPRFSPLRGPLVGVRVRAPREATERGLAWARTYGGTGRDPSDAERAYARMPRAAKDYIDEMYSGAPKTTLDRIWRHMSERARGAVRAELKDAPLPLRFDPEDWGAF